MLLAIGPLRRRLSYYSFLPRSRRKRLACTGPRPLPFVRRWISFVWSLDNAMAPGTHEETLRPRKGKWALILLLCGGFVGGGFWMARDADASDRFWGYFNMAFFGLGVLAALVQFVPGSSFLHLGSDGLTVRAMWRTTFYRWSDIERFGVARLATASERLIGLEFSASYPRRDRAQTVKKINRKLTGFEAALPDNYGWDYAELAAHLNRLRERYVSAHEPTRVA